jgi:hypothetical protein
MQVSKINIINIPFIVINYVVITIGIINKFLNMLFNINDNVIEVIPVLNSLI